VIEPARYRRRASDRAEERASRAEKFGDVLAFVVASAQAEAALRRREEWAVRVRGPHASELEAAS
jgi:hypothetical protein